MPTADSTPKPCKALMSLVMFVRKPTAVVIVASTNEIPTVRMARLMAPSTLLPLAISSRYRVVR